MLWLIKKELTANVRFMLLGFLIFILYTFLFSANGAGLFMLCLTISVYALFSTNLVLDERFKIDLLITTLPVRRRDMVLSKYFLLVILFAACAALYALLTAVAGAAGYERIAPLTFGSAMLGFFAASLYIGVTLPLSYRFGAQATRYVAMFLFFAIFALSAIVPSGALRVPETGFSDALAGALLLLGALAVNASSFFASSAIYSRKDL